MHQVISLLPIANCLLAPGFLRRCQHFDFAFRGVILESMLYQEGYQLKQKLCLPPRRERARIPSVRLRRWLDRIYLFLLNILPIYTFLVCLCLSVFILSYTTLRTGFFLSLLILYVTALSSRAQQTASRRTEKTQTKNRAHCSEAHAKTMRLVDYSQKILYTGMLAFIIRV